MIKATWLEHCTGAPTFRVMKKVSFVKDSLKDWNKNQAGNLFEKTRKFEEEISCLQKLEESGLLSVGGDEKLSLLTCEFHNLLRQQKIFWQKNSRMNWLEEGDANTRFFHRATICRRARNLINEI